MQSTEGWRDGESAILLQGERNAFGKKHRRASLQSDYSLTSLQCLFYSPCNFTYFWKVKQLYWSMTSIQEKISVINVNFKEFQEVTISKYSLHQIKTWSLPTPHKLSSSPSQALPTLPLGWCSPGVSSVCSWPACTCRCSSSALCIHVLHATGEICPCCSEHSFTQLWYLYVCSSAA